jgi:hypothetical protein
VAGEAKRDIADCGGHGRADKRGEDNEFQYVKCAIERVARFGEPAQ